MKSKKYGPWTRCYHGVKLKTKYEKENGHSNSCKVCVTQKDANGKIDVRSSVSRNYWEERKEKLFSPKSIREFIQFLNVKDLIRGRKIINQISVTLKENVDIEKTIELLKKFPEVKSVIQLFPMRSEVLVSDPYFERFLVVKTETDPKVVVKKIETTNVANIIEIVPNQKN